MSLRLHLSVIFLLVICVSCVRGPREPGENLTNGDGQTASDYRIVGITGTSVAQTRGKAWKVPSFKTYDFRVCLTARTTQAPLPVGIPFEVSKPNGTIFDAKTDNLGCINWKEIVNFNYAADSMYLERNRRIRGKGSFKGVATAKIGVNPWVEYRGEDDPEIIDLARRSVPDKYLIEEIGTGDIVAGFISANSGQNLMVDPNLDLKVIPDKYLPDGRKVQMILRMKPYIEPLNMRGERQRLPLQSGKFRIFAQLVGDLIGENQDQHVILSEIPPEVVEIKHDNTIVFDIKTDLRRRVTMGQVRLALKIVPVDAPFKLAPYNGLHNIGEFTQIIAGAPVVQTKGPLSSESFDYSSSIEKASNFAQLKEAGFVHSLPPVIYSPYDARFIRVKSGETSTRRTILYSVRTQVTDSLTDKLLKKHKFKLKRASNGEVIDLPDSDEQGFVQWTDEIVHLYYQPEQYFFPKAVLTHVTSKATHDVELAINPWDYGWTFGADLRDKKNFYYDLAKDKVQPSRFVIDAFRYQTIRFRYVIDDFMTLNVKKAVVMTFDPLVQRYSIPLGRIKEPLRDGIYLMKVGLVKYFVDPFQHSTRLYRDEESGGHFLKKTADGGDYRKGRYITIIKKLVRVQGSRITTPMEFSMRDLRMMSIRSTLMVQIEAIDENRLMATNIMEREIREYEDSFFDEDGNLIFESMSDSEKTAYVEDKRQKAIKASAMLAEQLAPELRSLQEQRKRISQLDYERFKALAKLELNLLSTGDSKFQQSYDEALLLTKKELRKQMKQVRSNLGQVQSNLDEIMEDWQTDYRRKILNQDHPGLAGVPPDMVNSVADIAEKEEKRRAAISATGTAPLISGILKDGVEISDEVAADNDNIRDEDYVLLPIPEENAYAARSLYDYLGVMQAFYIDNDLPLTVDKEDLEKLRINNYIEEPAAPFINLDLYVSKIKVKDDEGNIVYKDESGLERRTFLGPCTLVANDNMSDMRPTDVIDETFCKRIDCSEQLLTLRHEIDNSEYEDSIFHDSLKPYAGWHVDDLMGLYIENERMYERKMKILSQTGKFTKTYNLEYVSLTDKPLRVYEDNCTFAKGEECFKDSWSGMTYARDFFSTLNATKTDALLARYFHIYSLKELTSGYEDVTREDSLQPFFERLEQKAGDLKSFSADQAKEIVFPEESKEYKDENSPDKVDTPFDVYQEYTSEAAREDALTTLKKDSKVAVDRIESKRVRTWLAQGRKSLTLTDALRVCRLVSSQAVDNLVKENLLHKGKGTYAASFNYLLDHCFSQIFYDPDKKTVDMVGVSFDRRYRIIKAGPYEHLAGTNMNLNVGIDFSIAAVKEIGHATSAGIDYMHMVGRLTVGAGRLMGAGKQAYNGVKQLFGKKAKKGAADSFGNAAIKAGEAALAVVGGLTFQSGVEEMEGQQKSQATSVTAATFLVIQKADMNVRLLEHEKCLTTQFTPQSVLDIDAEKLGIRPPLDIKSSEVQNALKRGIFLCSGESTKLKMDDEGKSEPKDIAENTFQESYFYVTQHFTAGEMLDDANLLNHVWLLALRGDRDFRAFYRIITKKPINSKGEEIAEDEIPDYPLSRLGKVYQQVIPTFPGMYSVQD